MVFTKLLLENALAIRPGNCEVASEPNLPKVARCIPVLSSRFLGKCAARGLKRSGRDEQMQPGFVAFQISPRVLVLLEGRLFFRRGSSKKTIRWDFARTGAA